MKLVCECDSFACRLTVELDDDEAERLGWIEPGPVLIVDGCAHGPEPSDRLIEQRRGYGLYAPGPGGRANP